MLKDSKFTEIDEEFICEHCGKLVPKLEYSCRNHCPYCLHSKHVDKNPGDRAEECHGDLEPVSLEIDGIPSRQSGRRNSACASSVLRSTGLPPSAGKGLI